MVLNFSSLSISLSGQRISAIQNVASIKAIRFICPTTTKKQSQKNTLAIPLIHTDMDLFMSNSLKAPEKEMRAS